MKGCLLRLAAAVMAGVCLMAAVEIVRLGSDVGGERGVFGSPLMLLSLVGVGLAFVFFLVMATGPSRWRGGLANRIESGVYQLRSALQPVSNRIGAVLIVFGAVAYGVNLARFYSLQGIPEGDDQVAFLNEGSMIRDFGGPLQLVQQLYRGQYAEANRHPLFSAMLSMEPTITAARTLSVVIGWIAMAVLVFLAAKRFGPLTAGIFCVLLGTNYTFCYSTTLIACEGLLILSVGVAWLIAEQAVNRADGTKSDAQAKFGALKFLLLGSVLGVAYLTKGTGLLFLAGFLLWCAAIYWRRPTIAATAIGCALLGFVVIASPLLVRNIVRYGSPTYNFNSYYMFTDRYILPEDLHPEWGVGDYAREYLRTHSASQMVGRETKGLAWETFITLRTLGPTPLEDSRVLLGGLLFLASLLGMAAERRRGGLLVLAWLGVCVPLFAWYVPIAAGDRFVAPLLAPLLIYAAVGLTRIGAVLQRRFFGGDEAGERKESERLATAILIVGVLWCVVWTSATWASGTLYLRLL